MHEQRPLLGRQACVTAGGRDHEGDAGRLDSLTPFYPSPRSLAEALAHAVECGADELRGASDCADSLAARFAPADAGCCRSAYGRTVWHCEALDAARQRTLAA